MKHSLNIFYVTSRMEPQFGWFFDTLRDQVKPGDDLWITIVDSRKKERTVDLNGDRVLHVLPKPTFWQGVHRLTKEDWWAKCNALNTALCLCRTDWLACVDDRLLLMPTWLEAVRTAMDGNYAVCGPYEKRIGVTDTNSGMITGEDNRMKYVREHYSDPRHKLKNPYPCGGEWMYGCSIALPTEWALAVNGWPEDYCDSLSAEDYVFGNCLAANGFPIKYDLRMAVIEDRTPECLGPAMKRTDKGQSPHDKSHRIVELFKGSKTSMNSFDIRKLREQVLLTGQFPPPTGLRVDWYDGQPIKDFQ